MNPIPKLLALAAVFALPAASIVLAAQSATPAAVSRWHEKLEFRVLKTYAASDGNYLHRAYVIEWKDQEVIAMDPLALTKKRSDDTIRVLAQGDPFPQNREPYGLLNFTVERPKQYPTPGPDAVKPNVSPEPPSQERLRVVKVFFAQDGDYIYRAYAAEWKGQEVIVRAPLGRERYEVGDMIPTLVMKHPFPNGAEPHGLLSFVAVSAPRR